MKQTGSRQSLSPVALNTIYVLITPHFIFPIFTSLMVASFCIQLPPNVSNCTGISNSTWQKWNRFFPPKPDLPLYLGHTIIHQIAQTKTAKSSWILLFFLPSPPYPSVMSALPLNLSLICLLFYSSTFYSCHPSMSHYPFLLDHYISFLTSSCFLSCPLHQDFSFSHY